MEATIQKNWNLYNLEYKENNQNKVEISPNIKSLIDRVKGKVLSLEIKYI